MVARTWSSSRLSRGKHLLLRCVGMAGNSFPTTQGTDSSSSAMRRKPGSSGCGWDSRAFSRVVTGMSRNFLSCSKGGKDPLEVPEVRCDYPGEVSVSDTDSTQGLRAQHRWERNPERPPSKSHGDCPFLRPPERVPEVPVVSREHLPQLEKIQEFLPSRRDEAHFR